MIYGNIKNAKRYYALHPDFKKIFEFLATLSEKELPDGISGENYKVIVNKSFADTSDLSADGGEKAFEAHRDYIDIHYCVSGEEGFGYNDISALEPITEYNDADDYILLKGKAYRLTLYPGDFCIVYPEDAHLPMLKGEGSPAVLKAIAKVKLDY